MNQRRLERLEQRLVRIGDAATNYNDLRVQNV